MCQDDDDVGILFSSNESDCLVEGKRCVNGEKQIEITIIIFYDLLICRKSVGDIMGNGLP